MKEVFGAVLSVKDNVSGVMKQAKESTRGYRGEVEKAKKELEKLDKKKVREKELRIKNSSAYKAIEGVKKKLQPLAKKTIEIQAKTEHAVDKVKKVKSQLDKIKSTKVVQLVVKGGQKAMKAIGKGALVGTTAALGAFTLAAGAAGTQAASFQSQMQNVGTLLDGDVQGKLQGMSKQLKQVSIDTGAATSDLTDGLYQVVSAFGESAESVKQLEIAAKAAKAGNATTTDSVNMLSAVTKGYGDTSAAALQKASDLAFLTVKLGQTSFPELASSMGQVVPLAATMKVSQEELFGAMATLTGVTGGTAEVTTQLRATMQEFLSPSSQMEKALKKMGYTSGAAALESEGLGGILTKLKESVKGDEVAFANLFSSIESKNAVLALTGAQADAFAEKTAAMGEAAGATDRAFKIQTNSVSAMASKLKNAGSVMLTSLGEKALPYVQGAMQGLIDRMPAITETLGGVIERAGPMFGALASGISDAVSACAPVVGRIGSMFSGAFAAAQPAIASLRDSFMAVLPTLEPVVLAISEVATSVIPPLAAAFAGIGSVVAAVMPVVSEVVSGVGSKVAEIFGIIGGKAGILQQVFETVAPAISGQLSAIWTVAEPILGLVVEGVGLVADAVGWAFPYIQGVIEQVWAVIGPIVQGLADAFGGAVKAVSGAVNKVRGIFGGGKSKETPAANATGTSYFSGGWTTVGEHGPELVNLPGGSKILSNPVTQQVQGGSRNINVNVEHMEVRSEQDIERVAEEIIRKIEEAEDNQ